MKKVYPLAIFVSLFVVAGCSKDFLKRYEKRIIGTWYISDIDRFGIGGSIGNLSFQEDTRFTFNEDGTLIYTDRAGAQYNGRWDVDKRTIGEDRLRSLLITVVNDNSGEVITEYYDEMQFAGTNHFKTTIYSSAHTYVTHFRR